MDDATRKKLSARLRRAEGQVVAVRRMIDEDANCVSVLTQISAAQGALGRVSEIVLADHIQCCVADAFADGDDARRQQTIDDLITLFARHGRALAPKP